MEQEGGTDVVKRALSGLTDKSMTIDKAEKAVRNGLHDEMVRLATDPKLSASEKVSRFDKFHKSLPLNASRQKGSLRLAAEARGISLAGKTTPISKSLPTGATFEGILYRAVGTGHDPTYIHPGNVLADHRYTGPGVGGLYFATNERVIKAEFLNNGASLAGTTMHRFPNLKISELLDLSNPAIRAKLGVSLEDLTRTGGTKAWRYEVTQPLGAWAKKNGSFRSGGWWN